MSLMLVGLLLFLLAVLFPYRLSVDAISDQAVITRSILINGMRVVLIRNLLAPVVTVRYEFPGRWR